jgi:hypothetical protein
MLTDVAGFDPVLASLREGAIAATDWTAEMPWTMPDYKLDPFLEGFAEVLDRLATVS